jgi:hypothetical protein
VKWFGEDWEAPVCNPDEHAETPLGALCENCGVRFEADDRGVILPCLEAAGVRDYPLHLNCLLEMTVGPDWFRKALA